MVENNNPAGGGTVACAKMDLDFPFVKIPFEQLRRVFRHSQRLLEQKLGPLSSSKVSPESAAIVNDLINMIANEDSVERRLYQERCQKRMKFLDDLDRAESPSLNSQWEDIRNNRVIVEYLLSKGHFDSANALADHSNLNAMGFNDAELFRQLVDIETHLNQRSTSECLLWCFENRAHLKKIGSPLEFNLRRQTYTEHARKRDLNAAITYAKKFFPAWIDQYKKEIEQSMALLAIGPETEAEPYRSLYSHQRWEDLKALFRKEYLDLHALPQKSQLIANIQAGLSSLKTPLCGRPSDCNINCPVCVPPYSNLANGLPFSHHENSCIVCRITGQVMNENNPPMVLPNGRVYSMHALQEMAAKHQGQVFCPQTGLSFDISDAKKVFILGVGPFRSYQEKLSLNDSHRLESLNHAGSEFAGLKDRSASAARAVKGSIFHVLDENSSVKPRTRTRNRDASKAHLECCVLGLSYEPLSSPNLEDQLHDLSSTDSSASCGMFWPDRDQTGV